MLERGDITAIHVGDKEGVRAGGITAAPAPAAPDRQWLHDIGIDWDDAAGPEQGQG